MPANLPVEANLALERYNKATTIEEKIAALQEFLAKCPKHKGTEKILKWAKTQLAKLRAQLERKRSSRRGGATPFSVPKTCDVMVALLGVPGSGKTSLLRFLCQADIEDRRIYPNVGVFEWNGAAFQIVDLPSITSPNVDEIPNGRAIMSVARAADLIALVIDLTQDVEWQLDTLTRALDSAKIGLGNPPPIKIQRTTSGGIQVFGINYSPLTKDELADILRAHGVMNCVITFEGPCSVDDVIRAVDRGYVWKKAIVIATKGDAPGTKAAFKKLTSLVKLRVIPVSVVRGIGRDEVGRAIKETLDLIFVWTKDDKGQVAERAMILRRGARVIDVARRIHEDFVRFFRYALIERKGAKVPVIRAGLEFQLADGDIVRIVVSR